MLRLEKNSIEYTRNVLIIDENKSELVQLVEHVNGLGYVAIPVSSAEKALERLDEGIDLILVDLMIPRMEGIDFIGEIRASADFRDLPIVVVTGANSEENRLLAIDSGASDFVEKSTDPTELRIRLKAQFRVRDSQLEAKHRYAVLERAVTSRTSDLVLALDIANKAKEETEQAHLDTIRHLAVAAESRDGVSADHILRVSAYSRALGRAAGLKPDFLNRLALGSLMHDIGKIGVPDAILLKPGPLTEAERSVMREHTRLGAQILGGSNSKVLIAAEQIALTHHEHWDGNGYPDGLKEDQIPLMGRICAVADVFDALTSVRPYKTASSFDISMSAIFALKGKQFDPYLIDCLDTCVDVFADIFHRNDLKEAA